MSETAPPKSPKLSRRHMLGAGALVALAGAAGLGGLGATALAQRRPSGPDQVPLEELMKVTGLPDLAVGKADAPVTIVEYASMTCGHCANFHNKVFPTLKQKYVDTGRVRFIFREFPLDDRAAGASMLARCTGDDGKAYAMISALFARQDDWAFTRTSPVPELLKLARQAGFTEESFNKCLTDQKLLDQITEGRERAAKVFGVDSTPTFFINGKRFRDRSDQVEAFEKAIEPLLPKT